MRLPCNISRLFCVQPFCDQLRRIRFNGLFEEETCEGKAVIQRHKSFTDERSHFEQSFVIDFKSCLCKVRLDPTCQVVYGQEPNVGSIEVIKLLKIDCSR